MKAEAVQVVNSISQEPHMRPEAAEMTLLPTTISQVYAHLNHLRSATAPVSWPQTLSGYISFNKSQQKPRMTIKQ